MNKKILFFYFYVTFNVQYIQSQVKIDKNKNLDQTIIDFSMTKKGIVLPHLNAAQRSLINKSSNCPKKGLIGYDTIEKKIYVLVNPIINGGVIPSVNNGKFDSCGCWASFNNISEFTAFKNEVWTKINLLKSELNIAKNKLNTFTSKLQWYKIGENSFGNFIGNWNNLYSDKYQLTIAKDNLNKLYILGHIKFFYDGKSSLSIHDSLIFRLPEGYRPSRKIYFNLDRMNKYFMSYYNSFSYFNDGSPYCEITPDGYCILKWWKVYSSDISIIPEIHFFIFDNIIIPLN